MPGIEPAATDPFPPASAGALVPPRPNLGPEPLEPEPSAWPALACLGLALVLAALAWWRWAGRLKKRRAVPVGADGEPAPLDGDAASPRLRMVALSAAVREALATRFDETWRAKTTEEVAESPDLARAIGAEEAERLVAFLRAADRVKFAPEIPEESPALQREAVDAWVPWASAFIAAGASSKIRGK
jgi:hypothetical protein